MWKHSENSEARCNSYGAEIILRPCPMSELLNQAPARTQNIRGLTGGLNAYCFMKWKIRGKSYKMSSKSCGLFPKAWKWGMCNRMSRCMSVQAEGRKRAGREGWGGRRRAGLPLPIWIILLQVNKCQIQCWRCFLFPSETHLKICYYWLMHRTDFVNTRVDLYLKELKVWI